MFPVEKKYRAYFTICLASLFLLLSSRSSAQQNEKVVVSAFLNTNRLSVSNVVLQLPVSEEKTFWALYDQYLQDKKDQVADRNAAEMPSSSVIFLDSLLADRARELALRQTYFEKISKTINGRVGLQFLQTEDLLDIIAISELYEKQIWPEKLLRAGLKNDDLKIDRLASDLSLPELETETFEYLYDVFQFECSTLWGEEFNWFEQYLEDSSGLTPAQAYTIGKEFVRLQEQEVRIHRKHLNSFKRIIDLPLACGLIGWQHYQSVLGKLKAWSNSSIVMPADIARGE